MEEHHTFAVGHLAIGYLVGKASGKLLNVNVNIPLIFTLSILPDIDLLIPTLEHGGPTHSIIVIFATAFPAILLWRKQTLPYLAALISHPFLGDYLTRTIRTEGIQLFFPITSTWFSADFEAARTIYIYSELALFATLLITMQMTRDTKTLIRHHPSNFLLLIPISTALLPVFIQFPIPVPPELIIPHLILLILLTLPILIDIRHARERKKA